MPHIEGMTKEYEPAVPAKPAPRDIRVVFSTIDGCRMSRKFKTLAGAMKFAHSKIGPHPDTGSWYAVGTYGDAKIEVAGATLRELFPESAPYDEYDPRAGEP